jgi:sugar/nucleoside kinase (ribokinase family)
MTDVGCAGILVADTFCGPMKRLPRPGELLALDEMPSKAGGCAANVAIDLAKQGFAVDVCGCVGADPSAEVLLGSLSAAGVGCGQVRRLDSHPTSKTVIVLVEGEDRRYLHVFGANAAFSVGQIPRAWIDSLRVFYLGGLLVMPAVDFGELADLLAYCRGRGVRTVVDVVVPHDYSGTQALAPILPHVDYFLPNDDEARRLTGHADPERQLDALLGQGAQTVIVTCGDKGSLAGSAAKRWRAGAYRVDSIDPTGAGDAFAAGVVTGVLRGWEMGLLLRYAAALGASATRAIGTTDGVFTAEAGQAFLDGHPLAVAEE